MKILGIETATGASSVALAESRRVVATAGLDGRTGHEAFLVPAIDFCFAQAGWKPGQIDAIVVDVGPGLFTGMRVGIATAQGLAAMLGVPIVAASSLDALAVRAATGRRHIWSVVDVRRGEVAVAAYQPVPGGVVMDSPPELVSYEHFRGILVSDPHDVLVVGDCRVLPGAVLRGLNRVKTGMPRYPTASALAQLVAGKVERGEFGHRDDIRTHVHEGAGRDPGLGPSEKGRPVGIAGRPRIRGLRTADLDQVMELESVTFRTPWTKEVFEKEMGEPGRSYLVAEHAGKVVGYGGLMVVYDDAHINTLAAVRPGPVPAIGTRLMLCLVERGLKRGAQHLSLEVRVSNRQAQEFYRKFGMAPIGVRKHYYQDDDALIMWVHDIRGSDYRRQLDRIRDALP